MNKETSCDLKQQGCVKWFNKKKGYGFIQSLNDKSEFFAHHTAIKPTTDCYHLLFTGEYVEFDITDGKNGQQCENITGICGGKLMCDVQEDVKSRRKTFNKQNKKTKVETKEI